MTIEEIIYLIEAKSEKELRPVEKLILEQAWEGKTFTDIATLSDYGEHYLRKTASSLWKSLSEIFGESLTKGNFRGILETRALCSNEQLLMETFYANKSSEQSPPFPGSPLPLWSKFYIHRPAIEELAYAELIKLGSVIRIKAPRKMGKNSLLLRIMNRGNSLGYRGAFLDFQQAESGTFENLDKFLRWFCATVTLKAGLTPKLDAYWDETIGSKVSATLYFQAYLLPAVSSPFILGLNEVNILFQYPAIACDFFPMLRSWHEEAKYVEIWQRLRMIVVYSTEIYIPLNLNQSPFNIGLPIKLTEFNLEQGKDLAKAYNLPLKAADLQKLIDLLGGHPYLMQLAFHHLSQEDKASTGKTNLDDPKHLSKALKHILETATNQAGIYREYLRSLWANIHDHPPLFAAFKQVLESNEAVELPDIIAYKLESLGLIKMSGKLCSVSLPLYRLYFSDQLSLEQNAKVSLVTNNQWNLIEQLAKYKQAVDQFIYRDNLTGFTNGKHFKKQMEQKWLEWKDQPVSLMICQIDFLHLYNQFHGNEATDDCLQKVAGVIGNCVEQPLEFIGRLGEAKFAIFLPGKTQGQAEKIGRQICEQVKGLAIAHNNSSIDGLPETITVSIGGSSREARQPEVTLEIMLNEAETYLQQAQKWGGNRMVNSVSLLENFSTPSGSSETSVTP
ncbi:AAA-like domain-containing protein [Planktothricoides raciborskii]|uniref:AAA-like domain-containing protein n=1 Tax=Planktothricoides raciborskii FACHB-1370 TaxID=2949576 RepID=A0ABR8E8Y8_9CYAN|nr:AAA-like domain-containing protein [Planktothricoides raciborskii]MBD2542930.1 AAA-like domain-containing protein [Planktothricoides raciborskii FACHB-1370]MBD2581806.1 AAA-like domain-containing protein [Planktothricoides raciborskii FACHB-1261]